MPPIGPSFCILGVIMVTLIAAQAPELKINETRDDTMDPTTTLSQLNGTETSENDTTAAPSATPKPIITPIEYTTTGKDTRESNKTSGNDTTAAPSATPKPISISTESTTTKKDTPKKSKTDSVGITILVVIIAAIIILGVICFFARKRGRRYSVDFTSRPEETNIPLSNVEPVETVPQNGLQTFEPETKPLVQEEQEAEAEKSVDPSAESAPPAPSAAPAPSADSSEDKPKEDVAEQSPPAPVEPTVEEKTDDEGIVSNETSAESLKETNENNSNNADVSQKNDLNSPGIFCDVSLDSPV